MGTCWHCDENVLLDGDEVYCNSCDNIIFYRCCQCKGEFEVFNKERKEKLSTCPLCGDFNCPHCGGCADTCDRENLQRDILRILMPEISPNNSPFIIDKVKEIVTKSLEFKSNVKRLNCKEREVPITYAYTKMKLLKAKFNGYRTKGKDDIEAFRKRVRELEEYEIGKKLSVEGVREKGRLGHEERDALNFLVCHGKFKVIHKEKNVNSKKKEEKYYSIFERVEGIPCKYLKEDIEIILHKCEKCGKKYPKDIKKCEKCQPYKKGKKKGEFPDVKNHLATGTVCKLKRGEFYELGTRNEREE